jgi:two-component system response regulator PilR (NtrC family)
MSQILVVDDELSMREVLEIFFMQSGHQVVTASDGTVAIERLEQTEFDLVVTDLRMPRTDGLQVLEASKRIQPDTPVILMTAFASTETALTAMKNGAFDYFTKPFKLDEIMVVVEKSLEHRRLLQENKKLRAELDGRQSAGNLIGRSQKMKQVFDLIHRVARTRTNVLILGESGTGKELVARAVHEHSARCDAPFLVINCAAIPENLLESELFGHKKGTFTGANTDRAGLFLSADGGTLFLDEIGEMPMTMQVKLLRAIQERKVRAVGDTREIAVDVRVIAATNRNLLSEISDGRFREDLYYRLNVIGIDLPPLRERPTDIPLLAYHFLRKYAEEFGKPDLVEIEAEAMRYLLRYPYSGNVRELENIIERAVALEDGPRVSPNVLPPAVLGSAPPPPIAEGISPGSGGENGQPSEAPFPVGFCLDDAVAHLERTLIGRALTQTGGRKKEAARVLGITFRSLRYRLQKLEPSAPA